MTVRHHRANARGRARTPQEKEQVREAFIAAGRELFGRQDPATVSLRQIAAAAGYAPAAIYQYFADQRELFACIREHDMQTAAETFAAAIARTRDPLNRVRTLFFVTVDYWLAHIDQYLVLFPAATRSPPQASPGTQPFGRSPVVRRIMKIYYDAVGELFDSLPSPPMAPRLATDTLLAAVYGTIVFPRMTATMPWSDTRRMARILVQSVLDDWVQKAGTRGG
jgi:AcrR family transcriptional regulator